MQSKFAVFALVFILLLAACQPPAPTPAPIPTATLTPTLPPTATPLPTPTATPFPVGYITEVDEKAQVWLGGRFVELTAPQGVTLESLTFVTDEAGVQSLVDENGVVVLVFDEAAQSFLAKSEWDQQQAFKKYPNLKAFVESGGLLDFDNGFAYEAATGKVAWLQHPASNGQDQEYNPSPNEWYQLETPGIYVYQLTDGTPLEMPIFATVEALAHHMVNERGIMWGLNKYSLKMDGDIEYINRIRKTKLLAQYIDNDYILDSQMCRLPNDSQPCAFENGMEYTIKPVLTDDGKIVYLLAWRAATEHKKYKTTKGNALITSPLTAADLNAVLQALQWPNK